MGESCQSAAFKLPSTALQLLHLDTLLPCFIASTHTHTQRHTRARTHSEHQPAACTFCFSPWPHLRMSAPSAVAITANAAAPAAARRQSCRSRARDVAVSCVLGLATLPPSYIPNLPQRQARACPSSGTRGCIAQLLGLWTCALRGHAH